MSGDKDIARRAQDDNGNDIKGDRGGEGDRRNGVTYNRCFSGLEFSLNSGPLKDLDREKLKNEIRKWAKAVVAYARQISGKFGSKSPRNDRSSKHVSTSEDSP